MENVYKFLDEYVGSKFAIHKTDSGSLKYKRYDVISENNILIIFFYYRGDYLKIFRSEPLCETVGRFFGLNSVEAMLLIKDWFGKKHNIKKLSDLLGYINEN